MGRPMKQEAALSETIAVSRRHVKVQTAANSNDGEKAAARPLAELLACSSEAAALLSHSADIISFDIGQRIFR